MCVQVAARATVRIAQCANRFQSMQAEPQQQVHAAAPCFAGTTCCSWQASQRDVLCHVPAKQKDSSSCMTPTHVRCCFLASMTKRDAFSHRPGSGGCWYTTMVCMPNAHSPCSTHPCALTKAPPVPSSVRAAAARASATARPHTPHLPCTHKQAAFQLAAMVSWQAQIGRAQRAHMPVPGCYEPNS